MIDEQPYYLPSSYDDMTASLVHIVCVVLCCGTYRGIFYKEGIICYIFNVTYCKV